MHQSPHLIASPCVGLCSTTYGDLVCRGCMRTSEEILAWPSADWANRATIVRRLDKLLETIMRGYFVVEDQETLQQALEAYQVPFDVNRSPLAWLYKLLVRTHTDHNPEDIGIRTVQEGNLGALFQACRQHLYQHACVTTNTV